jgi:hypothetical protein
MNEPDPIVKSAANPLAQRGPSTHESETPYLEKTKSPIQPNLIPL